MSTPDGNIAQKSPYVKECEKRKYAWCACGRSSNQPFCDGSHKGTKFSPIIVDLGQDETVAWCGCKHSGNKPYCDGTHRTLEC